MLVIVLLYSAGDGRGCNDSARGSASEDSGSGCLDLVLVVVDCGGCSAFLEERVREVMLLLQKVLQVLNWAAERCSWCVFFHGWWC